MKLQAFQICNFIKKIVQHRCFPVRFFKNSYFEEHLRTTAFSYVCQVIENTAIGAIYFVKLLQTCLLEPSLLQKLKSIKVVIRCWFSVSFFEEFIPLYQSKLLALQYGCFTWVNMVEHFNCHNAYSFSNRGASGYWHDQNLNKKDILMVWKINWVLTGEILNTKTKF